MVYSKKLQKKALKSIDKLINKKNKYPYVAIGETSEAMNIPRRRLLEWRATERKKISGKTRERELWETAEGLSTELLYYLEKECSDIENKPKKSIRVLGKNIKAIQTILGEWKAMAKMKPRRK